MLALTHQDSTKNYEMMEFDGYYENNGLKTINFTNYAQFDFHISYQTDTYALGTITKKQNPPPVRIMPEGFNLYGLCYQESIKAIKRIKENPMLIQLKIMGLIEDWEMMFDDQVIEQMVMTRLGRR